MSSEVPIPEAAVERVVPLLANFLTKGDAEDVAWDAVRAAAPLVVAAYLDQRAAHMDEDAPPRHANEGSWDRGWHAGWMTSADALRAQASVLRGEGQT